MRKVYVGIDIGSKQCSAASINLKGKLIEAETFKTSEMNLISFVKRQQGEVKVLIEEGELAGWVMRTLLPYAKSVEVADPKRNAWIAKAANKNDRIDALKLAELLRLGSYSVVYHPEEEEMAAFGIVVKQFDEASKRLSRVKSQIKARLRGQGIMTSGTIVYGKTGRQKVLIQVENPHIRRVIEREYLLMDYLAKDKADARRQVSMMSKRFPVIDRLMKIPGVGIILASRFVAIVGNPHRFNKRTLASFSRLGIAKRSSDGSPLGPEHIDKSGNGKMKDLSRKAFESAVWTKRTNGIKDFYLRSLRSTGKETSARLNTQRKILAIMLAVWRDGTEYSDELVTGKRAFARA
jgi:transposase